MPGTITRWATPAAWWTWPISSGNGGSDVRHPQLRRGDHGLLGVHADRRRFADAGAAALLPARLYAVHPRLPVPALRDSRHLRQSRRWLAGVSLRHPAHVGDRPHLADRRPVA